MSNPIDDLIAGFQHLVGQVPEFLQPIIVAAAGAVPFIEGEGSAVIGVIGGLHPLVAGAAGAAGNLICVVLVVLLSSRIRTAALVRQARRAPGPPSGRIAASGESTAGTIATDVFVEAEEDPAKPESKGRRKVRRWLVRFGVPGASLLGPLAIPTHFTAAVFIASGVSRGRVILWQAVAIALWTGGITAVAMGFLVAVDV